MKSTTTPTNIDNHIHGGQCLQDPDEEIGKKFTTNSMKLSLLVYALPFFYGAITRLPFIYFVIHMRFHFNLTWEDIGLFVGAYQAARVVISFATIFLPKTSHFVGTSLGLIGSIFVLVKSNDDKLSFLFGTIAIGFSEMLSSSQTFLKNSSSITSDIDRISHLIKVQYAAVMFGVTFAFSVGGFVYDKYGINGIAVFGIVMSAFELLSFLCFLLLDAFFPENKNFQEKNDITMHTAGTSNSSKFGETDVKGALDHFNNSGIGANYINYILVVTFGMESITIGYNLAISPVFILEEFDKSATIIGIMLASGAACGTFFSVWVTLSKSGQSLLKSYLPSPYDLFISLGGISASVFTAAIPYFPVHFIGLLFLMMFNDMAAVILNDIQSSITSSNSYSLIGPMGQCVRRSFNVVTAITGPLLFSAFSRLPYIVAGSVTASWLVFLMIVVQKRMRKNDEKIAKDPRLTRTFSERFVGLTFVEKEILKREHKKGIFDGNVNEDESTGKDTFEDNV